jgi:hypothetical protein
MSLRIVPNGLGRKEDADELLLDADAKVDTIGGDWIVACSPLPCLLAVTLYWAETSPLGLDCEVRLLSDSSVTKAVGCTRLSGRRWKGLDADPSVG